MKNKGITLIAVIVTVIVMLILAGVGIGLVTGNDNNVITEAEKAVYKNSITQIEQKINEFYINNYSDMPELNNKALSLILYLETDKILGDSLYKNNWTQNTDNMFHKTNSYYNSLASSSDSTKKIISTEYQTWTKSEIQNFSDTWLKTVELTTDSKSFFLLNPVNLKAMFGNEVEILNIDSDYDNLIDVYAITSDLRVFYIRNGLEDMIGIKLEELSVVDENAIVFDAGSEMANELNAGKEMSREQIKAVKKLSITSTSKLTNINDIGRLGSITELTINNSTITSLEGISNARLTLKNLWLYGNKIESFEGLQDCVNLEQLYLQNFSNKQLEDLCKVLAKNDFSKLAKIGIFGYWHDHFTGSFTDERYSSTPINTNLTSISSLSKLTSITRNAVKTFILNNNNLTNVSVLSNFPNIVNLKLESNKITSLDGIKNHSNLQYLRMANNTLKSDALNDLVGLPKLIYLDLRKNYDLVNIAKVADCKKITNLWFMSQASLKRTDNDVKLSHDDVFNIKNYLNALGSGLLIDAKYSLDLLSDNSNTLQLKNVSINKSSFESLAKYPTLTHLSIENIKILDDSGKEITSATEIDKIFTNVLSKLPKVRFLQILNMPKIESINFVTNMKYLAEFDIRDCANVTNFTCLNNSTMNVSKLTINNTKIDLTTIQPAINKLGKSVYKVDANGNYITSSTISSEYWSIGGGLVLANDELYKQLPKCTELTRLYMNRSWRSTVATPCDGVKLDLSSLTKLKFFNAYGIGSKFVLPANVETVYYSYVADSTTGYLDLSKCTKMTFLQCSTTNGRNIVENMIKTIPATNNSLKTLNLLDQNSLKDLKFLEHLANSKYLTDITMTAATHKLNITSLEGLNKIKTLKNVKITYAIKLKELPDMSGLTNLQSLTITNSALEKITPETNLKALSKLNTLNFSTNNIANISGLISDETNEFANLSSLNLENNCLYNESAYSDTSSLTYKLTDKIFVPLYSKKLRTLCLAGNPNFTDVEKLKTLSWTKKTGF